MLHGSTPSHLMTSTDTWRRRNLMAKDDFKNLGFADKKADAVQGNRSGTQEKGDILW